MKQQCILCRDCPVLDADLVKLLLVSVATATPSELCASHSRASAAWPPTVTPESVTPSATTVVVCLSLSVSGDTSCSTNRRVRSMIEQSIRWPRDFAALFQQAVPDHLLEALCGEANAIAQCDNFWTTKVRCYPHSKRYSASDDMTPRV